MKSYRFSRLASSYFFYFCVLGLIVPFLGVFLDGKGFTAIEIGEIIGVFLVAKVLAPSFWAAIADKTGQQINIIRLGGFLAWCCFCLLFIAEGYWQIFIVLVSFSLFWTAILPQLEVLTLNSVGHQAKIYARIRLWGSIGFICIALVTGELLDRYSSDAFVYLGTFVLFALFISALFNRQPRIKIKPHQHRDSILEKIFSRTFLIFFVSGLLLQVSFGPYYTFFVLYLQKLGYEGITIGSLIALGVVAEIIIFIYAGKIFTRFSVKNILVFSLLLTSVRWYITGEFADSLLMLMMAQTIHAASFGLFHSASLLFLHEHFESNQQNRGQAIYISGVYGLGGAFGAYLSGVLWSNTSTEQPVFLASAFAVLLGGLLLLMLPNQSK